MLWHDMAWYDILWSDMGRERLIRTNEGDSEIEGEEERIGNKKMMGTKYGHGTRRRTTDVILMFPRQLSYSSRDTLSNCCRSRMLRRCRSLTSLIVSAVIVLA